MKTLLEIQDEYSRKSGFESFQELKKAFRNREMTYKEFGTHLRHLFQIVQNEQQEIIAKNAMVNCAHEEIGKEIHSDDGHVYFVHSRSIINNENIIK